MVRFNRHALATATLSEILAQQLHVAEPDGAFVAGLFHDVGQLVLISLSNNGYGQLLRQLPYEGEELDKLERELFGFTHGEISALATGFWKLPPSVQTAVRLHETPPPEVAPPEEVDFSLADVVHTADRSVTALGFSTVDVTRAGDAAESLSQLGLDDAKVRAEFQNQFDSLS